MEAVIGLLLMLLGVSHGVETSCDGRQDGAQCYGALGGTVVIQLMDSASEIFRYQWSKDKTSILTGGKNRNLSNLIEDRSLFTPSNGTFKINSLSSTDGGEYTLRIFDEAGKPTETQTLQLTIQAPVSSVLLVPECLSQGEMRVSCSSEGGDSPQYSWTLDGHTLTDAQLLSGNKSSNNITLSQDVSGQLVCSVSNHVSNVSKEANRSNCGFTWFDCTLINGTHISQWVSKASDIQCISSTTASITVGKETHITNISSPSQPPSSTDGPWYLIIAGVLAALVVLLVVGLAVVWAHKRKQNNEAKEEGDEQELTYADVKIVQREGRPKRQRAEVQVEYGQVKFSDQPRQTAEAAGDESVYAKVRTSR